MCEPSTSKMCSRPRVPRTTYRPSDCTKALTCLALRASWNAVPVGLPSVCLWRACAVRRLRLSSCGGGYSWSDSSHTVSLPAGRIGKINGIFASPPAPPTSASGRPARAALAAPPARRGGLQKRRAARRGAAMRGLDMRLRMGDAEDARVCRFGGLGTARWGKLGGPISNGIARRKGVR